MGTPARIQGQTHKPGTHPHAHARAQPAPRGLLDRTPPHPRRGLPATHRKFSIEIRTIEPSTKGPDDCTSGSCGAGFFLLLGTSDEGSLGRALLEAWGLGVDVFLLEVAILASSAPHSDFRSHRPAAQAPKRPSAPAPGSRANYRELLPRARSRDLAPRLRSSGPAASAGPPSALCSPPRRTGARLSAEQQTGLSGDLGGRGNGSFFSVYFSIQILFCFFHSGKDVSCI